MCVKCKQVTEHTVNTGSPGVGIAKIILCNTDSIWRFGKNSFVHQDQ